MHEAFHFGDTSAFSACPARIGEALFRKREGAQKVQLLFDHRPAAFVGPWQQKHHDDFTANEYRWLPIITSISTVVIA